MEKTVKFRGPYDPVEVIPAGGKAVSDRYISNFQIEVDEDGPHLVETDRRDVYAEIQAARAGTDLKECVARLGLEAVAGVSSTSRLGNDSFGDQTSDPVDLFGAYDAIETANTAAEAAWNKIPEDLRKKYGSQSALMSALDDGTLLKDLAAYDAAQKSKEGDE